MPRDAPSGHAAPPGDARADVLVDGEQEQQRGRGERQHERERADERLPLLDLGVPQELVVLDERLLPDEPLEQVSILAEREERDDAQVDPRGLVADQLLRQELGVERRVVEVADEHHGRAACRRARSPGALPRGRSRSSSRRGTSRSTGSRCRTSAEARDGRRIALRRVWSNVGSGGGSKNGSSAWSSSPRRPGREHLVGDVREDDEADARRRLRERAQHALDPLVLARLDARREVEDDDAAAAGGEVARRARAEPSGREHGHRDERRRTEHERERGARLFSGSLRRARAPRTSAGPPGAGRRSREAPVRRRERLALQLVHDDEVRRARSSTQERAPGRRARRAPASRARARRARRPSAARGSLRRATPRGRAAAHARGRSPASPRPRPRRRPPSPAGGASRHTSQTASSARRMLAATSAAAIEPGDRAYVTAGSEVTSARQRSGASASTGTRAVTSNGGQSTIAVPGPDADRKR